MAGTSASPGEGTSGDEESSVSVAEFVSQASHDLKTPLAAITGYVATLRRRGDELAPELRQEMLEHASRAASRMLVAIEQLVDYARLELGVLDATPGVADVDEVLQGVVEGIRESYPESRIELSAGAGSTALVDRDRLAQAIKVLVENAVVHGNGRARIVSSSGGGYVRVRVEDGGEGIPLELESLIFSGDLKSRPRIGQPRGLGVALHNARRLLRLFGGDIELISARGEGDYPGAIFELRVREAGSVSDSEGGSDSESERDGRPR